ncbi:MAG: hypothetical protein JWL64_1827 [Frankiales bacterium]|nr:hypothetical protein [Frankiales bacterium]
MTDSPPAARLVTPSWLDLRLVVGVLLVLVSVVVGARVLARADTAQQVWVVAAPLPAGSVLRADDVERRRARLFEEASSYLPAGPGDPAPAGYVLTRPVSAGELLPRGALRTPQSGPDVREVPVLVEEGHLPEDLARGQLVDVYVTIEAGPAAAAGSRLGTWRVLSGVPVSRGASDRRAAAGAVLLSTSGADTDALLKAVREGHVDLVRAPPATSAVGGDDPRPGPAGGDARGGD